MTTTHYSSCLKRFFPKGETAEKKIYFIHKPEVQCIGKGKEHKRYEFGNKVTIIRSATGLILGAMSFRKEYDGHTIKPSLERVERLTGRKTEVLAGDRGYRKKKEVEGTKIMIPDVAGRSDRGYRKLKKHGLLCKRAGKEPTIGHLKSDYRPCRNFYKGVSGDAVNVLLAAPAYNFKRVMKALSGLYPKNPRDTVYLQQLEGVGFLRAD